MVFLIFLQGLFISLFLHLLKVLVLFHSSDMIALALEAVAPFNSSFISRISLQKRLCAVFFGGTSTLDVFRDFTLKALHTLSTFCINLSLSSSNPLVNSQSILRKYLCLFTSDILYISKHLTCISKGGRKFFHNSQGLWKFIPPHHRV